MDINHRRIILVLCSQQKNISRGWAGALTWVVSMHHPAGEQTDASHVLLSFYKMAQRVLKALVLVAAPKDSRLGVNMERGGD